MAHFSLSLSAAVFLALLALTAQALTVPLATLSKTTLQPVKDGAGRDLSDLVKSGVLGNRVKLVGLVKEVAPCATAKNDEELGVSEFQSKYFNGFPLYLDESKAVYAALGDRKITSLKGSWNPFVVWQGLKSIGERIKAKSLDGNMRGEGLVLGGILVVKNKQVVYTYYEETGKEIPKADIIAAVKGK